MEKLELLENFKNIYKNKTVLVTGHTGFKGAWLSIWLKSLGANVIGYSLAPYTCKDIYVLSNLKEHIIETIGDIRDRDKLKKVFDKNKPEYVFHLAAQPLVIQSYLDPIYTYETNVMGTLNILECIRESKSVKIGIFSTSDKCYENKEQFWGYRENDKLGGLDPYSSSKSAAEIVINSYRHSFMNPINYDEHKKAIASVRAGNVIGGGDWQKNRIVPDCIKSLEENKDIILRNPNSVRPWQYVLEAIRGYLLLGQKMMEEPKIYSTSFNFAPTLNSVINVEKLSNLLIKYYKNEDININYNNFSNNLYESKILNLDISKAYFMLNWYPKLSIEDCVKYTVQWYKNYKNGDIYNFCLKQIKDYSLS